MAALFALLILGLGLAFAFGGDGDESDEPEPTEPGEDYQLSDGDDLLAGSGDDTLSLDPEGGREGTTQIGENATLYALNVDAGAGNDSVDLIGDIERPEVLEDSFIDPVIENSLIDLGDGEDTILAVADTSTILGGDGDDVMTLNGNTSIFDGGAGDDLLTGQNLDHWIWGGRFYSDASEYRGGDGNDTIDLADRSFARGYGDAGDDLLIVNAQRYFADHDLLPHALHGGEGDDTLRILAPFNPNYGGNLFGGAYHGGEGSDRFELIVDEGERISLPTESNIARCGRITDFDRDEDSLVIDVSAVDNGYTYDGIRVETENDDALVSVELTNGTDTGTLQILVQDGAGLRVEDIEIRA